MSSIPQASSAPAGTQAPGPRLSTCLVCNSLFQCCLYQEVMARVRRFKYRPNDDELKALNSLSRRERPRACVPSPCCAPWPAPGTCTHRTYLADTLFNHTGLAVWSGLWGTATSVVTYQLMRRISSGSGRARPIAVALASGAWVTGYRVQAFPVRSCSVATCAPLFVLSKSGPTPALEAFAQEVSDKHEQV